MQTITYRMNKQQGPTVQRGKLHSTSCPTSGLSNSSDDEALSEGHEQKKVQRTKKIIVNTAVGGKDENGQMKKPLSLPTRGQI